MDSESEIDSDLISVASDHDEEYTQAARERLAELLAELYPYYSYHTLSYETMLQRLALALEGHRLVTLSDQAEAGYATQSLTHSVVLSDIRFIAPRMLDESGADYVPLSLERALRERLSYSLHICGTITYRIVGGDGTQLYERVHTDEELFVLPCMVGAGIPPTLQVPPHQGLGEYRGVFVINGSIKRCIMQRTCAQNVMLVYRQRSRRAASSSYLVGARCISRARGTMATTMIMMSIELHVRDRKSVAGRQLMELAGEPQPEQIAWRQRMRLLRRLRPWQFFVKMHRFRDGVPMEQILAALRNNDPDALCAIARAAAYQPGRETEHEFATRLLSKKLLAHLEDAEAKIRLIEQTMRRMEDVLCGDQEEDSRDTASNQRIETPGVLLHRLVMTQIKQTAKHTRRMMALHIASDLKSGKPNHEIVLDVRRTLRGKFNSMRQHIERALRTGNWGKALGQSVSTGSGGGGGGGGGGAGNGLASDSSSALAMTSQVTRMNILSIAAQFTAVTGAATNVSLDAHYYNCTYVGRLCPVKTPESEKAGIILEMAQLTFISQGDEGEAAQRVREWTHDQVELAEGAAYDIVVDGVCVASRHGDDIYDFAEQMRWARAEQQFGAQSHCVSIAVRYNDRVLNVLTDAGRIMMPLICCERAFTSAHDPRTLSDDVIEILESRDAVHARERIAQLVRRRYIEFVDSNEDYNLTIGRTHQFIIKSQILGRLAAQTPNANQSAPARNTYAASQMEAAIGPMTPDWNHNVDKAQVALLYPQRPLSATWLPEPELRAPPIVTNFVFCIGTLGGANQEDGVYIKREALERGAAGRIRKTTLVYELEPGELPGMPQPNDIGYPSSDRAWILSGLDEETGLPRKGQILHPQMYWLGVRRAMTETEIRALPQRRLGARAPETQDGTRFCNTSRIANERHYGYVTRVAVEQVERSHKFRTAVYVTIELVEHPIVGDKFSTRHAQKGVIAYVMPERDMPFTADGVTPDLVMTPHGFASRMTVNQLVEAMQSKAAALSGRPADATTFRPNSRAESGRVLGAYGYRADGKEMMYSGATGEPLGLMLCGIVAYASLKQLAAPKCSARGGGVSAPRSILTHQPSAGISKNGALRFGEMEMAAVVAHGGASLLQDAFMERGDAFEAPYCSQCHDFATPIAVTSTECRVCQTPLTHMRVPYGMVRLSQELGAMGIRLRLKAHS